MWCWRAGVGCADKAYPSLGFAELELTIGVATGVLGALSELPAAVALEGVLLLSRSVPEIQALRRDMALDFSGVESHLLCDALRVVTFFAWSSAGVEWAVWCWRAGVGRADRAYPSLGYVPPVGIPRLSWADSPYSLD